MFSAICKSINTQILCLTCGHIFFLNNILAVEEGVYPRAHHTFQFRCVKSNFLSLASTDSKPNASNSTLENILSQKKKNKKKTSTMVEKLI